MTFSKPKWDGVQFDWASDKYMGTVVYSRISSPGGSSTLDLERLATNATSLFGGRVEGQVGDFATVGLTYVNSHQSNTLRDGFSGDPFSGELTIDQNKTVSFIEIVLRDDSPEDGKGGAAYFPAGSDIIITYSGRDAEGMKLRDEGQRIRFEPIVEGGFIEEGYLAADGAEEIRLRYDFNNPDFVNRSSAPKEEIEKVEFRLVLGNDYQIWITSSQQVSQSGDAVLLPVTRAEGNVQDNTNLRVVSFEYGLPTATQILGGTLELSDVAGFDVYAEYDLSYSFTKYPNIASESHSTSSGFKGARAAPAWMINASRSNYPWFLFGEVYSMNPRYNTRTFATSTDGFIGYDDTRLYAVELVEDNDDQDRFPDTRRRDSLAGDREVFPGWDENNDFISDFNQNDNAVITNSIPDYEESFLRHNVDRPEFLFGIDLNNNLWVDRFENDEDPDYPYRKDHEGFNLYGRDAPYARHPLDCGRPARRPDLLRPEEPRRLPDVHPGPRHSRLGAVQGFRHAQVGEGRHTQRPAAVAAERQPENRGRNLHRRSAGGARHLDQQFLGRSRLPDRRVVDEQLPEVGLLQPAQGRGGARPPGAEGEGLLLRHDQQGQLSVRSRHPLVRAEVEERIPAANPGSCDIQPGENGWSWRRSAGSSPGFHC